MLRLIEKIIDYIFSDYIYVMILLFIMCLGMVSGIMIGAISYDNKLQADVKLAKIAAGQVVECEKCKGK
jgi:hypothetical protein